MKVLYVSKASVVAAHRDKLSWLAREVDLEVVVPDRWPGTEPLSGLDTGFTRLPVSLPGRNHFHVYRGLGAVMDRFCPDVVHMDEEPYSAVTCQGGWAAKKRGIPWLFFAAQNVPKRYPPPFHGIRKWVFRNAAAGVAGTRQAAEVLLHYGFEGRLRVIPQMGVSHELFAPDRGAAAEYRARFGLPEEGCVVAFVGRLVPEKAVDVLIEAVARVDRVCCAIVGRGPEEERLRAAADRLGLSRRVTFVGPVASLEVPAFLKAVDVLCLPSRSTPRGAEQFGRVLVEAMSTGVPVVVTDCGGMPEVVGPAGIVVPQDDVAALASVLESLASDAPKRDQLGATGRARVAAEFSTERVTSDTVRLYRELMRSEEREVR